MGRIVVRSGDRYGRLSIVREVESPVKNRRYFLCKCDCGNEATIRLDNLRSGDVISCGCARREIGHVIHWKHGFSPSSERPSRIYKIWECMRQRCNNPNYTYYNRYGGRGIKVCPEWDSDFLSFKDWAFNNGYSDDLTIDRIDVNGNYNPSNCRWVNNKTQANNRRTNVLITYRGETHTMSEWADITGIKYWNIKQRYEVGLPLEQVFFNGDLRKLS